MCCEWLVLWISSWGPDYSSIVIYSYAKDVGPPLPLLPLPLYTEPGDLLGNYRLEHHGMYSSTPWSRPGLLPEIVAFITIGGIVDYRWPSKCAPSPLRIIARYFRSFSKPGRVVHNNQYESRWGVGQLSYRTRTLSCQLSWRRIFFVVTISWLWKIAMRKERRWTSHIRSFKLLISG